MNRFLSLLSGLIIISSGISTSALAQTPAINAGAVYGGASYSPAGLPNAGIAQGSFFTIFGTNLGPSTPPPGPTTLPLPTVLGESSVSFTVGGTTTQGIMVYVSATQINGILPSSTPTGTGTVSVTYNGSTSASAPVTVVKSNFGIFTQNSSGAGPAILQDFSNTYALNSLRVTVKPGDVGILYGTGLGPVAFDAADEANGMGTYTNLITADNLDLHLYVGGVEASISYGGRSGFVGLDQINFAIPAGAPTGCYVPLIVRSSTTVSNVGSISVDNAGAVCSDPYGLTPAQITQAATGKLSVASLLLTRLGAKISGLGVLVTEDDASGRFYQFDGTNFYTSPEHLGDFIGLSSFGSCSVSSCSNKSQCVPSAVPLNLTALDAGASLTVAGNSLSAAVPKSNGFYAAPLGSYPITLPPYPAANFLEPGSFTFSGPGGADIGAFSANISVPDYLTWSSPQISGTSSISLSQTQDTQFTWTGGNSTDYVLISITSATNSGTLPSGQYNSATITCLQKASVGSFTVPSWLLQALPVSGTVSIGGLSQPGGAVVLGIFNVSHTFTSSADVSLANSIVLSGQTLCVGPCPVAK